MATHYGRPSDRRHVNCVMSQESVARRITCSTKPYTMYSDDHTVATVQVYNMVYESASTGGPLKGAAFWQWYDQGQVNHLSGRGMITFTHLFTVA